MLGHVLDRLSEGRVRLDAPLGELLLHPLPEPIHQRTALFLVQLQPLLGRESLFVGIGIDPVHLP